MALGKRIEMARIRLGIKQQALCDRVNKLVPSGGKLLTQQALDNLEKRDSETTLFVVKLADVLGVSVRWLQDGEGIESARDWPFTRDLWAAVATLTGADLLRAENTLRGFAGLDPLGADLGNSLAA